MTHYTIRNLNQKAIYWGNPTNDGEGGFTYDDPVEIDCRVEDISMVEPFAWDTKREVRSEVFLAQDVDEEGMMLIGELIDLDSAYWNDPVSAEAHRIMRFDKIPTLRGNQFVRKAYLGRLWTGKT